ncbi:type II toxin-antitoxin system PemK/MazF family toxin [Candidatus Omnitrophota bacterium]
MSKEFYPKRGDIYLVNFSKNAVGSEQKGYRPALIIQNNIGNKHSPTVIIAAFTTQFLHTHIPTNVVCRKSETGLDRDSAINLSQLRTISKERLKKKVGSLNEKLIKKVNIALVVSLGLIHLPAADQ